MGDLSADVRRLLSDARTWRLPEHEWQRVDRQLRALAAAAEAGDEGGMKAAIMSLNVRGAQGRRVRSGIDPDLDRPPAHPAAGGTRDLLNRLVHHFGPPPAQDGQSAPGTSGQDGSTGDRQAT